MDNMKDSYTEFFDRFNIDFDDVIDFGIESTICAKFSDAKNEWEVLKKRIADGEKVYVRGFGRDAKGTSILMDFYSQLLGNHKIEKDPTNNAAPTKLIGKLTGKHKVGKDKNIQNYQVSHIFGKTKNVYAFTAPWNIAYVPKIIDPFTGHEGNGDNVKKYTQRFQADAHERYADLIENFNMIMNEAFGVDRINQAISNIEKLNENPSKIIERLRVEMIKEFAPIVRMPKS